MELPWRCSERQKQYQSLAAQHTQRTVQSYQIPIYIWKSTSKSNASSLTFRELSAILGIYLKFSTELNMEQFWSDGWVSNWHWKLKLERCNCNLAMVLSFLTSQSFFKKHTSSVHLLVSLAIAIIMRHRRASNFYVLLIIEKESLARNTPTHR